MMKKVKFLALCAMAISLTTSCEKDESPVETSSNELPKSVLSKLEAIGVNPDNASMQTRTLLDGSKVEGIRSGDLFFTKESLMSTPDLDVTENGKQYRTNNLVSGAHKTIDIIGYTGGGGFGLNSKEQTGLQWAVNNYNRLNLSITFRLTFGTDYQSKDIVVYHDPNEEAAGKTGGVAGFPTAQGRPHNRIALYGLGDFSNNVNEHVITHEIGHAIGFRHTDWATRRSCNQSGESAGSTGAIHIPGTPSGYDSTSIMLACFSASSDGEFNDNDITALNYLY